MTDQTLREQICRLFDKHHLGPVGADNNPRWSASGTGRISDLVNELERLVQQEREAAWQHFDHKMTCLGPGAMCEQCEAAHVFWWEAQRDH